MSSLIGLINCGSETYVCQWFSLTPGQAVLVQRGLGLNVVAKFPDQFSTFTEGVDDILNTGVVRENVPYNYYNQPELTTAPELECSPADTGLSTNKEATQDADAEENDSPNPDETEGEGEGKEPAQEETTDPDAAEAKTDASAEEKGAENETPNLGGSWLSRLGSVSK